MTHNQPLKGRVAIITGASAGIGQAVALDLAARGAGVILNARRESRLDELAQRITDQHGMIDGKPRAIGVPGDASDDSTIDSMLQAAQEHFGKPADLIIANAGRGLNGSVMTSDTDQWEEMIRTNLLGVSKLIRRSGEQLLKLNEGRDWTQHPTDIVVLGSTVGRHISPFSSMYGATKFGVNSLAEAARRELGPKGIRVTLIEPGIVKSEFQSVAGYDPQSFGDLMEKFSPVLAPEDVARTIGFIVSQPAGMHVCDVVIRPTRQDYP
ncbi:MAG: SDR family oxidoreductase [Phycisphaerales bacterium JB052]